MRRFLMLTLAFTALQPASADAYDPSSERGLILGSDLPRHVGHRDLVDEHRALAPSAMGYEPGALDAAPLLMAGSSGPRVTREVLGYLPYWAYSSSPYRPARWDLLTILAWFGVAMDEHGDITTWHGWGGETTAGIVAEAHAHDVKVIVTVTNFDNDEIATLVNSPVSRANAIDTLLDVMAMHDADGVNIDFEFVPASAREGFKTFMADLKAAVTAVQPNGWQGHVSLAGPSVDWHSAYDYDALLETTDGIMVMAYGYHWSGGDPGPISPLFGGSPWGTHSVAWTIDDYLTWGKPENRHKVIIGLPWYGRNWPVPDTNIPTTALGSGATITFKNAEAEVDQHGRNFDEHTQSTYYHKTTDGQLRQVWYDDKLSFTAKVAYVDQLDLGGVGIWALGYEGGYPDFWEAIDTVLGAEVVEPPDPGPEPVAEPGPEPVAEPGAEPVVEPGPEPVAEPGPEPVAEPGPEALAELVPDAAASGAGPGVGQTQRNVQLSSISDTGGGCRTGPGGPLPMALLLVWFGWSRRRRSTRAEPSH